MGTRGATRRLVRNSFARRRELARPLPLPLVFPCTPPYQCSPFKYISMSSLIFFLSYGQPLIVQNRRTREQN